MSKYIIREKLFAMIVGFSMLFALAPVFANQNQNNSPDGQGCSLVGSYNYNVTVNPDTVASAFGVNTFTSDGTLVSNSTFTSPISGTIFTGVWTKIAPNQYKAVLSLVLQANAAPIARLKIVEFLTMDQGCQTLTGTGTEYFYPKDALDLSATVPASKTISLQLQRIN